ncbi:MAG: dTMP kinase [Candidatus Dasytiphilus stammeri]
MKNSFIAIEGLEGAGKTTICNIVVKFFKKKVNDIILTHEPGGTPIAEQLRILIKEGIEGETLTAHTELLMLYAARLQLMEQIVKPALARGAWVISDRHELSTQAYQSGGRRIDINLLKVLSKLVLGKLKPTLTLYLDITPELGLQRIRSRGKMDRIEQESIEFFNSVRRYYLAQTTLDNSIKIIDATQPLQRVISAIHLVLEEWWKKRH